MLMTQAAQHFASVSGDYSTRRVARSGECSCQPRQYADVTGIGSPSGGSAGSGGHSSRSRDAGFSPQLQFVRMHRRLAAELQTPLIDAYAGTIDRPFEHYGDLCSDHPPRTAVTGQMLPWHTAGVRRAGLARRLTQSRRAGEEGAEEEVEAAAVEEGEEEEAKQGGSWLGRRLAPSDRHNYTHYGNDRLGKRRLCCDCTHYCHTPRLWDEVMLTPLVGILSTLGAAGGEGAVRSLP